MNGRASPLLRALRLRQAWAPVWAGNGGGWTVLGLTLLLQFFLQAWVFPLSLLSDGTPLLHIDSAFHQYQMQVARQLCAEGRNLGYEPSFAAGQLGGLAFNGSAKLQALLACAYEGGDAVAVAYKQLSFWQGVIAPGCLVLAALLLNLPTRAVLFSAVLALLLWWTGAMRWYHTAGMVSYVMAAFVGVPFCLALMRVCKQPTLWSVLAVCAASVLGIWLHPLFPLGAALAGAAVLLLEVRDGAMALRCAGVVVLATLCMLVSSWDWLAVSLQGLAQPAFPQLYQRDVLPALAVSELLGLAPTAAGGSRLYGALVVGAVLCVLLWRGTQRRALWGLTVGGGVLMLWASLGALSSSIAAWQPNRFSSMAWLCLAVPAAAGFDAACSAVKGPLRTAWSMRRLALGLPLAAALLLVAYFVTELGREVFASPSQKRYGVAPPEVKGPGLLSTQLLRFLHDQTNKSARVLFEVSLARVHDGAHMAGWLASAADREFIGGPYPYGDFASAWDGFAFGQVHAGRPSAALGTLLDTYNVGWMLCHSPDCKAAMAALPDTKVVATIGPITAFQRAATPGFVVQGQATVVDRCVNRLELAAVAGPLLVLRYHWVPGLVTVPAALIKPMSLVPGARPFVAIQDPPPQLVLRIGEGSGLPCKERAELMPAALAR